MTSDSDGSEGGDGGRGGFADQLAELDIEVDDADERAPEREEEADAGQTEEAEQPSDRELLREAVDGLDDREIREAKFDGAPVDRGEEAESDDEEAPEPPASAHAEAAGDGRMADELEDLGIDAEALPDRQKREPSDDREDTKRRESQRSSREIFEEAVDGMSPAEMRRRKFDLPTGENREGAADREAEETTDEGSSEAERARREEATREQIRRRREEQKFEAAMQDVERIDGDQKYRAPSAPDPSSYFEASESSRTASDLATPTLPKSGEGLHDIAPLDDAQEALIERAGAAERRGAVPELNLRGETSDAAVDRLREFFDRCRREGIRFARIIPGRGVESEPEPVLKPLVLRWLETSAVDRLRGYAPERQFGGDYGSLVVEFRDPSRSPDR